MRTPLRLLLDGNIYDRLAVDDESRDALARLVACGEVRVVVSRTVAEELARSPFRGVPQFFPVQRVTNTVRRVGMRCGDSIGLGNAFRKHLGESKKENDALIADAATWHADVVVSCDERLRARFPKVSTRVACWSYDDLATFVRSGHDDFRLKRDGSPRWSSRATVVSLASKRRPR